MKYEPAPDIQLVAEEISKILFPHVDVTRLKCFRSYGSSSRGTIARCHALGKLMQEAIGIRAVYALEFISERFDRLDREEQLKIIIHELMHIPQNFSGALVPHRNHKHRSFRHYHDKVETLFQMLKNAHSPRR